MSGYTLSHELSGERQRLALMSELLDPFHRTLLERLGLRPGWRCLEIGCGNGSVSQWLAERVAPTGHVVASDIDTKFLSHLHGPCLEVRRIDILQDDIETAAYDCVLARAVLHHLSHPREAIERMLRALKPGGLFISTEPDMLPCTVAEPATIHAFWKAWLRWSCEANIDYYIGREIAAWLDALELAEITAEGHTAVFNGGSDWAQYWTMSMRELAPRLLSTGYMSDVMLASFCDRFSDPHYWTSVITFITTSGFQRS